MSEPKIWLFYKTIERHCINHCMGQQPTWIGPILMGLSLQFYFHTIYLIVHFMSTCLLSPIKFTLFYNEIKFLPLLTSTYFKGRSLNCLPLLSLSILSVPLVSLFLSNIFGDKYNNTVVVRLFRHLNKTTILK